MVIGYEVVRVIDGGSLIDAESYQRKYRAPAGRTLLPGCYVVGRPDNVHGAVYDERAEFIGPFDSLRAAESALRGLGAGAPHALPRPGTLPRPRTGAQPEIVPRP
jgi:hypothetical protein